jgi:UDP-N-acetyl-D-mannosaminuronic acid dehydrogenase
MNIYRDTNIALANEFAIICEKLNIDVLKAINAANVERKTHLLIPGLVGGYCLPKDVYHLVQPAEKAGYSPRLITVARELNRSISDHILELVDKAFVELNVPLADEKVAVLGLGFKANNGSLRNSQAIPIIKGLKKCGALVIAHDPFVRFEEVAQVLPNLKCVDSYNEVLRGARCAVIITDHSIYRVFTASFMKNFMLKPCAIVDARQIIDPEEAAQEGVIFRGFGKPELAS